MLLLIPPAVLIASAAPRGSALADDEPTQMFDQVVGNQTSDAPPTTDGDTALGTAERGTAVDVPVDPADGIEIDFAASALDAVIVPLDDDLTDFVRTGDVAVADGLHYATIAQPLEGGGFRLGVEIDDASTSTLSYDIDLGSELSVVQRVDGGFDFLAGDGTVQGGLAAPWAVDATGAAVPVRYDLEGSVLTRTLEYDAATTFPVVTNWCIFGKNSSGGCRGAGVAKTIAYEGAWAMFGTMVCGAAGLAPPPAGYACVGGMFVLKSSLPGPR